MSLLADLDTRLHILGYAGVAIEKAARRKAILAIDMEAMRLLHEYPNSSMSLDELRNRMMKLAMQRGVRVEVGFRAQPGG